MDFSNGANNEDNDDFIPTQASEDLSLEVEDEGPQPAGFNERFLAYVIDAAPFLFAHSLTVSFLKNSGNPPSSVIPILLGWFSLYLIYQIILSSGGRVTLGKLIMGLRIVDYNGGPLPIAKAFIRAIGYMISGAIVELGFIMALFTKEHKALHDYLAGSKVISIKERGDLGQGIVLALSWALMITLGWAWVHNNVLNIGPQEKKQIMTAHRTVSKLGLLEDIYYQRNGFYTNDLGELAKLLGSGKNIKAMKTELMKNLDYKKLVIDSNGREYTIKANAKNWRKTEVSVSSKDKKKKQAK
ncbi:MAG: RDD family protein [Elusimicrobiales bacterium]|nr:RDD family protein [Elusimicrobiales bacterium]